MGVKTGSSTIKQFFLAGGLIFLGGSFSYYFIDKALDKFVDTYASKIEKQLSSQLGHPLEIGSYNGLRPWGIAIGPSKVLVGLKDKSSASASGVTIQLAPLASLINRRPVAIFTPKQTKLNLKANNENSYWVFGNSISKRVPNIDLVVRLREPAKISLDQYSLEIDAKTQATFNPRKKYLKGRFFFDLGENGALQLSGNSNWERFTFQGDARAKRIRLKSLQDIFLNKLNLSTQGVVDGNFSLSLDKESVSCKGRLKVGDVRIKHPNYENSFLSDLTSINCSHRGIQLSSKEWKYGPMSASVKGKLPIKKPPDNSFAISSIISLSKDNDSQVKLDASVPISFDSNGIGIGELAAQINTDSFNLNLLEPLLGIPMGGSLTVNGSFKSFSNSPNSKLSIAVNNPRFGAIRLQENWQGTIAGLPGGGTKLNMTPTGAALAGSLKAELNSNWLLRKLMFDRLDGQISVQRDRGKYLWKAEKFRLDRLEIINPLRKGFQRVFGELVGEGSFKFDPLFVDGKISYSYLRALGIKLKQVNLKGSYFDKQYSLDGELFPDAGQGKISINTKGRFGKKIWARAVAEELSPIWISENFLKLSDFKAKQPIATGSAADLKGLSIQSPPGALDNQLRNWVFALLSVKDTQDTKIDDNIIKTRKLDGYVNAVAVLEGPELSQLTLDLNASGKVWIKGSNVSVQEIKPFAASFKGPLNEDLGNFSLINIPFSLLSLFVQPPASLGGMFGINGTYRLKKGGPEVTADLVLTDARLADQTFVLERGKIFIDNFILKVDILIKADSSSEPISLFGNIPLKPSLPFDLRVETHGKILSFLDGFSNGVIVWQKREN